MNAIYGNDGNNGNDRGESMDAQCSPAYAEALGGVMVAVKEAASNIGSVTGLIAMDYHKGDKSLLPAFEHAKRAGEAVEQAVKTLHKLGVPSPTPPAQTAPRKPFDLSALAALDTSDKRELLELLEQAQAVAERVDAASGRTLPAHLPVSPSESRGTDLAESISNLTYRLRGEVHGQSVGRE